MAIVAATHLADWSAFLLAVASVLGAVAGILAAYHARQANNATKIPSNGVKLGSVVEGISQVQHMLVMLAHPDSQIPPATAVGRSLEASGGTDGLRAADPPILGHGASTRPPTGP